jgi:uncharacterized delta-60 repeat protein
MGVVKLSKAGIVNYEKYLSLLAGNEAFTPLSYRLQTLGGASIDIGRSVGIDSVNNIYALGYTASTGAGFSDFLLVKYDSAGIILWQRVLGGFSDDIGNSVAIDSADNVYALGYTDSTGAGLSDFLLAKYDSSGTLLWQRILGGASQDQGLSVAIDSSDNVYVTGYTASTGAGDDDLLLAKYNSSGTIQWQRVLGGANAESGNSVAIDSGNNVYVLGLTRSTGAGNNDFLLAKYNSSGTIQWQRVLGGASLDIGNSVAIDSADNVYVLGRTFSTGAGNNDFLIAKYDSSGTIQWQRSLGGASDEFGNSVAIDSANNVYVFGYTRSTGAGDNDFLLAKYNSSGTIQWQRSLGGASDELGYSVAIDSADNVYVLGYTESTGAGNDDFLLGILPNDGSLTGTYVLDGANMTYAASTLTAATSSLTASTASLTAGTSTLTSSTSTLTSATASLTEHRVDL